MADRGRPGGVELGGHVRVVTLDQAAAEARDLLDDFEARYGLPSIERARAFTGEDGQLQRTGDYLLWSATFERWRQLTGRAEA